MRPSKASHVPNQFNTTTHWMPKRCVFHIVCAIKATREELINVVMQASSFFCPNLEIINTICVCCTCGITVFQVIQLFWEKNLLFAHCTTLPRNSWFVLGEVCVIHTHIFLKFPGIFTVINPAKWVDYSFYNLCFLASHHPLNSWLANWWPINHKLINIIL